MLDAELEHAFTGKYRPHFLLLSNDLAKMQRTLLSPFASANNTAPAILLPASVASTPNLTLSYDKLASLITSFRLQLTAQTSLQVGDVISMSLINSTEFAAAFLGVTAHR